MVTMEVSVTSLPCLCPRGVTVWDMVALYIGGFSLSLFYTPVVVLAWFISPAI